MTKTASCGKTNRMTVTAAHTATTKVEQPCDVSGAEVVGDCLRFDADEGEQRPVEDVGAQWPRGLSLPA